MAFTDTTQIESAFNALIDELSKICDLVDLADTYRQEADIMRASLETFITISDQKYKQLEQVIAKENAGIDTIKRDVKGLNSLISSQIESAKSEVANAVSTGLSNAKEAIINHQSDCRQKVVDTIVSVQNHLSEVQVSFESLLKGVGESLLRQTDELLTAIQQSGDKVTEARDAVTDDISKVRSSVLDLQSTLKSDVQNLQKHITNSTEGLASKLSADLRKMNELATKIDQSVKQNNSDIAVVKDKMLEGNDVIRKEAEELNFQLKKYLTEKFSVLSISHSEINANINSREANLLEEMKQLSSKIDRNNKVNKILTIVSIVLSVALLCVVCLK